MPEADLALTLDEMAVIVGRKLGLNVSVATYSAITDSNESIKAGLRSFYFPGMNEGVPHHRWSFLRIKATTSNVASSQTQALPDDFGSIVGTFSNAATSSTTRRIDRIGIDELLAIAARDAPTAGEPLYAAIRTVTAPASSTGQRFEVVWLPTPDDTTRTYDYTYDVLPGIPGATGYPYGGVVHAQTILQSCLAQAELLEDDEKGVEWDRYIELLKSSIAYDQDVYKQAAAVRPFPIGKASTDLSQLYDDCLIRIGGYMDFGHDFEGFTHPQIEIVDSIIQQGLRQMYEPPVLPGETGPHQWRSLQPVGTIDLWKAIAHTYDKTAVTVTISGTTATASSAIFTSDMVGDYICYHDSSTGVPTKITAFTSSTVVTVADSLSITAKTFTVSPYFFTASGTTITAGDSQTPFFASMVGRTIAYYNKAGVAETNTIITFTSSSILVIASDTLEDSDDTGVGFSMECTGDFRLPKDFAGIRGPLTHVADSGECHFEVDVWHESRIRRERQCNPTRTGRPQYAGIEPLKYDGNVQYASDGTTPQAYELRIWPCPDSDYVVEFQYDIVPPKLTSTVKYLPGGAMLHETILASCLAAAELEKTGEQGPRWAKFMERLTASVGRDRVAMSAEKIGLNRDLSDQPPGNLGRLRHTQGHLVTYAGDGS